MNHYKPSIKTTKNDMSMWPCAGHGVGLGEVLEIPGATGGALPTDRPDAPWESWDLALTGPLTDLN